MIRRLALLALACVAVLSLPSTTPRAEAGVISLVPDFFPRFTGTGTIVQFGVLENAAYPTQTGGGDDIVCTFWQHDDTGALYFFDGIDNLRPGQRYLVSGNVCLICFTYNLCNVPASALLNVRTRPLPPA
jgi:hypothetical protein